MTTRHTRLSVLLPLGLALALALPACGSDDGSEGLGAFSGQLSKKLKKITGDLSGLASGMAQVSLVVGKQQITPTVDPQTRRFVFDNLPEGPKTLVVKEGDTTRTLRFPKSERAPQLLTSLIPETTLRSESFDLGHIRVAEGGHLEPEHNPLEELVDTDGDGQPDYFDEDIDGDGEANDSDDAPFGDDYADVAWTDGCHPAWDTDGNGVHDWEEGSGAWSWDDVDPMTICAEDDLDCWMALYCEMFPADAVCGAPGPRPTPPSSAGASCGAILECAIDCADDACIEGCLMQGDGSAQDQVLAIAACAESCGGDELCIGESCGSQIDACFGGAY